MEMKTALCIDQEENILKPAAALQVNLDDMNLYYILGFCNKK